MKKDNERGKSDINSNIQRRIASFYSVDKPGVEFDDKLLRKISTPSDLKKLNLTELNELAAELRGAIIKNVSKTGGHLASNLGVVELTIALHYCFDSPRDSIVWDVGHQCYSHKMLTGRYREFSTLRQPGGISGFTNPNESIHDVFFSGHASTSISSAFGIAMANKIKGRDNYAVAVIGDGAFTGGMAYEALNNAGKERSNLIVILNDNEMSISENVGSFAQHLAVIKARPEYLQFKAGTERILKKIPYVGDDLANDIFKLKTTIKKAVYRESTMFEDLGFRYMGPLDGHNISVLIDAIEAAKTTHFPILIHICTKKGKGYDYAELDPSCFHGISKFDINTGEFHVSDTSFSSEFGSYLLNIAKTDNSICAITAAMSLGTGLEPFKLEFPDRFFDVGIAEEHAVTFASGLAKGGMKPVFAVYSAFLQRAYDQLVHDAAIQRLNITVVIDRAGFVSGDGVTHQGILDVPFINSIPDTTVWSPATYEEMRRDLKKSIYETEGLSFVRMFKGSELPLEKEGACLSYSDFDVFGKDDSKIVIVSYGRLSYYAYKALKFLNENGYKVKFIKLNKIKPLNIKAVEEAENSDKIFFFEECEKSGGVGEIFNEALTENHYKGEFILRAIDNEFVEHSTVELMLKKFGLDSDSMIKLIIYNLGING